MSKLSPKFAVGDNVIICGAVGTVRGVEIHWIRGLSYEVHVPAHGYYSECTHLGTDESNLREYSDSNLKAAIKEWEDGIGASRAKAEAKKQACLSVLRKLGQEQREALFSYMNCPGQLRDLLPAKPVKAKRKELK